MRVAMSPGRDGSSRARSTARPLGDAETTSEMTSRVARALARRRPSLASPIAASNASNAPSRIFSTARESDASRASREDDETNRRRRSTSRASTSSREPSRNVDHALALGALCAWLRAHGAWTRATETTTFARSTARGVGGVATRDLDEGEVRAIFIDVPDAFFV